MLIPNETETQQLTGMPVGGLDQVQAAGRALQMSTGGPVVVTLGAQGALLVQESGTERISAFEVAVVDTTAAGDAFVSGFSVAFAEGKTLAEAVRWGNAAGALASTRLGAQTSLPGRGAIETLMARA